MKKLIHFLRTGHWPKKFRYPNGIPETDKWERNVITYRITDPIWYTNAAGHRVQILPDGSSIIYSGTREHG